MVVKATCKLYVGDSENKSVAGDLVVSGDVIYTRVYKVKNKNVSDQSKPFLCPKYQSEAWVERFKILEFIIDKEGYLSSPKVYKEDWDVQTRAMWLRSVGMSPTNISIKLNIDLATLEKHWIDRITKNYNLRPISQYDWATIGKVDNKKSVNDPNRRKRINFGGIPSITAAQAVAPHQKQNIGQMKMDTRLNMLRAKLKKDKDKDSADCG